MKNSYLFMTVLLIGLTFISCRKKETILDEIDPTPAVCAQEDFLGLWDGSASCDSSTINSITIQVSLDGDNLITNHIGHEIPTTINNCTFRAYGENSSIPNLFYTIEGELIENELRVSVSTEGNIHGDDRCDAILILR